MLYGPNTNLAHNSIIYMLECQSNYISYIIKQMIIQDILSINIKKSYQDHYYHQMQQRLHKTVWNDSCNSWYKVGKHQKIINNSPYTTIEYYFQLNGIHLYINYIHIFIL